MKESTLKRLTPSAVAILLLSSVWAGSSDFVGTDNTCVMVKATLCNRRPPEECRFESSGVDSDRGSCAVDPETFFRVTVLQSTDPSKPLRRYLKMEWSQELTGNSGQILLRFSPVGQERLLKDHVVCMSNSSYENEGTLGRVTLSTLVPLLENATSSVVDIKIGQKVSTYSVDAPKLSGYSWILPAVSITTHRNKAYISISAPDISRYAPENTYETAYALTLICYSHNMEDNSTETKERPLGISHMEITQVSCSSSEEEVSLAYNKKSTQPIVYDMTQEVYVLVVDARVTRYSGYVIVAEDSLWALPFRHSGERGTVIPDIQISTEAHTASMEKSLGETEHTPTGEAGSPLTLQTTEVPFLAMNLMPLANTTDAYLSDFGQPSESRQTGNRDNSRAVLVITTTTIAVALVAACLFLAVKLVIRQIKRRNALSKAASGQYDNMEINKGSLATCPSVLIDSQSTFGCHRKQKFQPECCKNRYSGITSDNEVSDPLISTALVSKESLHQISDIRDMGHCCKDATDMKNHYQIMPSDFIHHNCNDFTSSEDDLQRHSYLQVNENNIQHSKEGFLGHHRAPGKQRVMIQNGVILEMAPFIQKDINRRGRSHDTKKVYDYRNRWHTADESLGYFSKDSSSYSHQKSSRTFSVSEMDLADQDEFNWDAYSIIKPEVYVGNLDPQTMTLECMRINQMCEDLSGHFPQLQGDGHLAEDECFSVCESIAC